MRGEKDPKRLNALRQRIYERGNTPRRESPKATKAAAAKETSDVPRDWDIKRPNEAEPTTAQQALAPEAPMPAASAAEETTAPFMPTKKRQSFRLKVIIASLFFFVAAVVLSSLFIMFGGNTISGDNITIRLNGPFTVGGGEVMNVQVGIINENNVSIESATLVVDYPQGARSVDEEGNERELFTERLPLEQLEPGESMNVPLKIRVYGEENEEQTINASVEYRVSGSNSTFYKQAEPLRFKISSSPVVMSLNSLSSLASGQETDLEIEITSNANTTLNNLLLRLEYPSGFEFKSSEPRADSGRNAWIIDSLEPEESTTITITGVALGSQSSTQVIKASLGAPSDRDQFTLSSTLTTASLEYAIEQPFIGGEIRIGNNNSSSVSVANNSNQSVTVVVRNDLDETIYDGVVTAQLSGSALRYTDVDAENGFYDSNSNTVTWDVSSVPNLSELAPGEGENLSFTVTPNVTRQENAELNVSASFAARRSSPDRVQETLTDSLSAVMRIRSQANLLAQVGHNNGIFADQGPIPPEVGEETTYTISMQAQASTNGIDGATVTATLPTYVTWLDKVKGDGNVTYNTSNRSLEWNAGDIAAGNTATVSIGVSILPSTSQIDTTPALVRSFFLRGTDRNTSDPVTAQFSAVTTEMTSNSGYGSGNGEVRQ